MSRGAGSADASQPPPARQSMRHWTPLATTTQPTAPPAVCRIGDSRGAPGCRPDPLVGVRRLHVVESVLTLEQQHAAAGHDPSSTARRGAGSVSRYQKRRVLDPGPCDAVPFKQHSRSSHEDPRLAGRLSRGRDAYFGQVVVKDGDACQSYGYSPPLHGAVQNPVACRTPCGGSSQLGCHRCERFQCHRAQSGVTGRVLNEYLEAVLARWQLRRPGDVADYVPERCIDQPDHGGFVGRVHFRGPLTRLDAGPDGERQGQRPHGPGRKCTATLGWLAHTS